MYKKIVESLAAINHMKVESTAQGKDVSPSDGKHSSSHEPSVSHDELIVCTNTSKTGAPVVLRSGSHDELNTTARSDETIFAVKPKLPKYITLPRFSGKVTKFQAFWDSFERAIDKNPSLSTVEKFNYLMPCSKEVPLEVLKDCHCLKRTILRRRRF